MKFNGLACRFCQQCGRFQPLAEFDGAKRSCRKKLLQHNAQRKRARDRKKGIVQGKSFMLHHTLPTATAATTATAAPIANSEPSYYWDGQWADCHPTTDAIPTATATATQSLTNTNTTATATATTNACPIIQIANNPAPTIKFSGRGTSISPDATHITSSICAQAPNTNANATASLGYAQSRRTPRPPPPPPSSTTVEMIDGVDVSAFLLPQNFIDDGSVDPVSMSTPLPGAGWAQVHAHVQKDGWSVMNAFPYPSAMSMPLPGQMTMSPLPVMPTVFFTGPVPVPMPPLPPSPFVPTGITTTAAAVPVADLCAASYTYFKCHPSELHPDVYRGLVVMMSEQPPSAMTTTPRTSFH